MWRSTRAAPFSKEQRRRDMLGPELPTDHVAPEGINTKPFFGARMNDLRSIIRRIPKG
jgi:hypothetical protein